MLSILIPVYNHSVVKLVKELHDQCLRSETPFEILVFDDASKQKFKNENQEIEDLFGVNYVQLSTNQGRSKIRNRLSKTALYDNLLFLDSDSKISSRKFIKNYKPYFNQNALVCGGRIYNKKAPKSKKKKLHWTYGTKREALAAVKRSKNPSAYFHSNNFLIPASIIHKYPFDEDIQGYGYEDLLFAHRLQQEKVNIVHIDNPIIHSKLESTIEFIEKHELAIINLARLYKSDSKFPAKLTRTYAKLDNWHLVPLVQWYLNKNHLKFKAMLTDSKPNLQSFDKYRLYRFIQELEKLS